ncbi:hypothetical protein EDD18DRAFT_1099827 [Armillaria luteobubalina]|uniref:Uncharacterized protein n=1 Tax=Armillaria luteobubalina TaxID=153913 RepID=A0AA39QJJ4_9AGAR|nr:hypothetical protein EDD18DRAFT_1099827 [Armillaria luteobubalina]
MYYIYIEHHSKYIRCMESGLDQMAAYITIIFDQDYFATANVFTALHLPFPEFCQKICREDQSMLSIGVFGLPIHSASIPLDKSFSLIGGSRNSTIHEFRAIKHIQVSFYIMTGYCAKFFNGYRLKSHTSQTLIIMDLVPMGNTDNKVSQAIAARIDIEGS